LREHDEDVHDQQDARDDREETEEDEHLAEPIHALRRTLDGVCLRLRNREGGTRREVRTDLSDGRIGPKVPNLLPAGVRNEDRVDLTRHPEVRLEGIEAEEEVVPIVPSASPFVSDDLEHRDGNRDEPSRPTEVQGEFIARLRLDGLGELRIDDRLRCAEAGPRPRGPVRPDEGTEVPIRRPATTIATWVLRRQKLPTPIRSGNRFRPAQPRTARQVPVTRIRSVRSVSIGPLRSSSDGPTSGSRRSASGSPVPSGC